jgi:hypothetical protein
MKKLICIIAILTVVSGCKKKEKDYGSILYKISYEGSTNKSMSLKGSEMKTPAGSADTIYTQFGQYITSLTPASFKAKFQTIRYSDGKNNNVDGHLLELINNNAASDAPERFADFSNNSTVNVTPILYGTDLAGSGDPAHTTSFTADKIDFIYFYFCLNYFYQEVTVPAQYNGLQLSQFNQAYNNTQYYSDSVLSNNILTVDHFPLMFPAFSALGYSDLTSVFAFGNTDSTYISTTDGNNSIFGFSQNIIVRSNKYVAFTLYRPDEGETLNMNTVLSFNSKGLIQVYAGNDNIPYTSDDVFVYAPKFWERLSVNVETN